MTPDLETTMIWTQLPAGLLVLALLVGLDARARGRRLSGHLGVATAGLRDPGRAIWVLAMVAVLPINAWLTSLDARFAGRVGGDWAPGLVVLEGGLGPALQVWTPLPWAALCTWVYVAGFPALILAAVAICLTREDVRPLRVLALAFAANYTLAQPFYWLLPVSEVHAVHPGVRFLIAEVSPRLAELYRPMSGLDNCFPSLHTSLSVTTVLALWPVAGPRLRTASAGLAAWIVLTTLVLGIHWGVDLVAGAAFGGLCWRLGVRLAPVGEPAAGVAGTPAIGCEATCS